MTDDRTTELMKLLDERGEHYVHDGNCVTWSYYSDPHTATESMDGTLIVTGLTPEQAISATLGGGTLTVEQVEEAVYRNCKFYEGGEVDVEAIADELNSRAERTCKQEERGWSTEGDHARVWLTCGHDCMVPTVQDLPNYCPNCGCKVTG